MHTMRRSLDGAYTLSILRMTFYLCTEISGGFAEVSEHEASDRTTRDTRYTRDTLESVCAMSCIRNNVRQTVVTRLFVFAYSVINDEQKSKFIVFPRTNTVIIRRR